MVRAETNTRPPSGRAHMFVIWGLHGEAGCHGGVATGFFVDTSGQSPTCADKRTERVGLGRSRTRPNPTAQLSLGGRLRTCPRSFSHACFTYEASWFGVLGCPGVSSEAGRSSGHRRKREKGRGRNASAFFLGLTGQADGILVGPSLRQERDSPFSGGVTPTSEKPGLLLAEGIGLFREQPTISSKDSGRTRAQSR